MLKIQRRIVTLALVLATLLSVAAAQRAQPSFEQVSYTFLQSAEVRKELKLTPQQNSAIQADIKRLNETMRGLYSKRPANEREAKAAQEKAQKAQLSLIGKLQKSLTAPQKSRLRQIALQQAGPFALLSPELTKEIGLDAAQTSKFKAAQRQLGVKVRGLQSMRQKEFQKIPQPKDKNDKKAVQEYMQKAQAMMAKYGPSDAKTIESYKKSAESQAIAALTSAQKAKWKTMLGAPFKVPKKPSA